MTRGKLAAAFLLAATCFCVGRGLDRAEAVVPEPARKSGPPIFIASPANAPRVGERLSYSVRWLGIPIGKGRLRIERQEGRDAYLAVAEAEGNDFLNAFHPVKDRLASVFSAASFEALVSEKSLREGRYRAEERVAFDLSKRTAHYESFLNGSKKEIPLEGPTQDVLSAFYWFRGRPVKVGDALRTWINADEKNWEAEIRILRTERLEIRKLGTFDVILVEPVAAFKGVLTGRGRAWVYFTADKRRIPVMIKLKTPFGAVVGILDEIPSA